MVAGKLWHELLRDSSMACGYKHRPNDNTTTWKRVERKDGKTAAVSIILVFVDDFMHIGKTYTGSDRVRDKLHADLRTKALPPLKLVQPSRREQLDILSIIQMLPGFLLFVSQPGYSTALAEQYAYKRKQNSPLPSDFNSRTVSKEDHQELLGDKEISHHRKEIIHSLASPNSTQYRHSSHSQADQVLEQGKSRRDMCVFADFFWKLA